MNSNLRGGVDILTGLGIHDAQSPESDGSDLIDTKGLWKPSIVTDSRLWLRSDMSASTLNGRRDTCACLRSPGVDMPASLGRYLIPELGAHSFQARSANTQRRAHRCLAKLAKLVLDKKKTFRDFHPMMRPDPRAGRRLGIGRCV